jgi:hypothetical protein
MAVKTINKQILPALAAAALLALGGCGLDADEETSTATTPPTVAESSGATGASGPSGPTGPTGAEGSEAEPAEEPQGAGLGTEEPEPAG